MYLLKQQTNLHKEDIHTNLHSTMYLLKHNNVSDDNIDKPNLHSTMYLLKRRHKFVCIVVIFIYIPLCIY